MNVRISCASQCRIKDGDNYLLLLNVASMDRGTTVYTPIGGGLEFDCSDEMEQSLLRSWGATKERSSSGLDIRLQMDDLNIKMFEAWFNKRHNREIAPDRELYEELVDEMGILTDADVRKLKHKYIHIYVQEGESLRVKNIKTRRYLEVFEISMPPEVLDTMKSKAANSNNVPDIISVSKSEILAGKSSDGYSIAVTAKCLL